MRSIVSYVALAPGSFLSARNLSLLANREAAEGLPDNDEKRYILGCLTMAEARAAYWRGNLAEAADKVPQVSAAFQAAPEPDAANSLGILDGLAADIYYDMGNLPEAERALRSAAGMLTSKSGNQGLAIFALQRLSDVLIEQARWDEAKEVINRCVALERSLVHDSLLKEGKDPGQVQTISMSMPDLALASQEYERAEKLFQEKVDYWEKMVTRPDNIDVTRYQFHLARAQQALGKSAEAVATLRAACATAEREFGPAHPRTAKARERVA